MTSHSASSGKSPLDAAQKIVAELDGMPPDQQKLAVRFAMETLGLQMPTAMPSSAPQVRTPSPSSPSAPTQTPDHSTDIRSFTTLKAPKSDQQFAAVVAYFYQFEAKPEQKKDFIDADIMKEAARLAGRAQVQRWNMTLTNAKNAGYLDGAGAGKYKLSSVGENLVAITLPGDGNVGQIKKSGAAKKPSKQVNKKKR
jgi:hypothetical protein